MASTILVEAAPLSPDRRVAASVALAVMIPWYLVLARPVLREDDEKTWHLAAAGWRGPVYLVGVTGLLAVALYANPNAWFLAFALSPQCFQLTAPNRRAMAFVVLLNGVAGLVFALASRSDVRLRYTAAAVELSVADDGRGFVPGAAPPGALSPDAGFGLRGMRERLRQAGGTLTVRSAPGAGTTVRAELPA